MVSEILDIYVDEVDDGSEELLIGFWPIIKRVILLFFPIWIILIGFAAGLNMFITAVLAGVSVSVVVVFEKFKVRNL
ncbi:MAG: hypothetical protein L7S49_04770 [Candidatus Poseidoniaceae archaeon]|nr:hypothetical protein [Candidatus Poseidoniaceae archaeon]